jgi:hypothetical protein
VVNRFEPSAKHAAVSGRRCLAWKIMSSRVEFSYRARSLPRNVNSRSINYLKLIGAQRQTASEHKVAEPDTLQADMKCANEVGFNDDRKAINGEYLASCSLVSAFRPTMAMAPSYE